MLCKLMLSEI